MQQAVRDAVIGFIAAMSQAQAESTKEAQRAGIDHAKGRDDVYLGRKPSCTREQFERVVSMLGMGEAVQAVAKTTGLSRSTVYRIRHGRADAEVALAHWHPEIRN